MPNPLDQQIAAWENAFAASTPRGALEAIAYSPLCAAHPDFCQGCPVREATGEKHCKGTPRHNAYVSLKRWTDYTKDPARLAPMTEMRRDNFRLWVLRYITTLKLLKEPKNDNSSYLRWLRGDSPSPSTSTPDLSPRNPRGKS